MAGRGGSADAGFDDLRAGDAAEDAFFGVRHLDADRFAERAGLQGFALGSDSNAARASVDRAESAALDEPGCLLRCGLCRL